MLHNPQGTTSTWGALVSSYPYRRRSPPSVGSRVVPGHVGAVFLLVAAADCAHGRPAQRVHNGNQQTESA